MQRELQQDLEKIQAYEYRSQYVFATTAFTLLNFHLT